MAGLLEDAPPYKLFSNNCTWQSLNALTKGSFDETDNKNILSNMLTNATGGNAFLVPTIVQANLEKELSKNEG